MGLIKKYLPGVYKFVSGFFAAMNNKPEGHSLRKWLAVGFFWLTAVCVFRYTDSSNVVLVLGVLTGMITALIITYSVSNHHQMKLEKSIDKPKEEPESNVETEAK